MAIAHIGEGKRIDNVDTEKSPEATAIRSFLDMAIDIMLRDFDWPFATVYASPSLVATAPTIEWGYSYRYPSDCVVVKRILTGERNLTIDNVEPFKIGQDKDGLLIYTDAADMQMKYISRVANTGLWPNDFVMALSYYLATLILPSISAGDPFKRGPVLSNQFAYHYGKARANAANEEQMDKLPESEFIRARNDDISNSDFPRRTF